VTSQSNFKLVITRTLRPGTRQTSGGEAIRSRGGQDKVNQQSSEHSTRFISDYSTKFSGSV
jgi:hypothetical protein